MPEEEFFEPFSAIADASLVVLTLWISYLFWKPYRQFGERRNLYLSLAFLAVAIFKALQFFADKVLGLESFEWMDSNLASEAQIIFLAAVVIWVLARRSGAGAQARPRPSERKAA